MKAVNAVLLTIGCLFGWMAQGADPQTGFITNTNLFTPITNSPLFTTQTRLDEQENGTLRVDFQSSATPQEINQLAEVRRAIRGFLERLNPLGPALPPLPVRGAASVSPRAWITVVGWHTGNSAFPDPVTHEPDLALFTASTR